MEEWWSIEISGNDFAVSGWIRARGEGLIRTALEHGARDWDWVSGTWGVVLEFCFADELAPDGGWSAFIDNPLVKAALDAVPDPISGLMLYPGRGGSCAAPVPRRPKPAPIAAAAALPEPEPPVEAGRLRSSIVDSF
ncbi:MAG TPA: hypothetical protein VFU73_05620 [Actinocrinis sp.]|nr:hypothetical protein [Actinocrinis sp.]